MSISISKYLKFLQDEGWSDLIDSRWEDQVKQSLLEKFLEMTKEEWDRIADDLFV